MMNFMSTERLLYLVNATDNTGQKAWYYVLVFPEMLGLFKRKLATKNLTLTEFGAIIESGYGESVPENIRKRVEARFKRSA